VFGYENDVINWLKTYKFGLKIANDLKDYSSCRILTDLENVVRELSKFMDGASLAAYKEMMRVIKFVLDTKDYCLKLNSICENEEWDLVSYSDSDCAGNTETIISVTGFIIYFLGAPICWRSKEQKGVTLSSTKLNTLQCRRR
jgi:hypothetical protein